MSNSGVERNRLYSRSAGLGCQVLVIPKILSLPCTKRLLAVNSQFRTPRYIISLSALYLPFLSTKSYSTSIAVTFLHRASTMKLFASLLWVSSALEASFVAAEAFIYTSDVPPLSSKACTPSISPNTARLLFARRLGLSQYHSLDGADESTLDILNTYGGKQQQLFAHEEHTRSKNRLLLIIDGVTKPEGS